MSDGGEGTRLRSDYHVIGFKDPLDPVPQWRRVPITGSSETESQRLPSVVSPRSTFCGVGRG